MAILPENENLIWLNEFRKKYGRSPRILHIGNIANNAYNNAKLLNQIGLECDVICYDYYHIMSSPEWEDADFEGEIKDQFFPNWNSVKLQGFQRPKWFVQGPLKLCIYYLIAKSKKQPIKTSLYRFILNNCRYLFYRKNILINTIFIFKSKFFALKSKFFPIGSIIFYTFLCIFSATLAIIHILIAPIVIPYKIVLKYQKYFDLSKNNEKQNQSYEFIFDNRTRELVQSFETNFPQREDNLKLDDLEPYRYIIKDWIKLFECYDIIQGYSTDPIYPMIAGCKPYVAYEHGTIRDIPFENQPIGRLTALSYKLASHSFITNPDCIFAAKNLDLSSFSFVPHVIDEKYYDSSLIFEHKNSQNNPYIICPSRHDWAVKGTNITILGYADFVKNYPEYRLVLTAWGLDVNKSKNLICELGINDKVDFLEPMSITKLIKYTRGAAVLIDQFKGYFGGIAPTALSVGTPLIMHLDYNKYSWCFKSLPPYFEAVNKDEVSKCLSLAIKIDKNKYKYQALAWLKENYYYQTVIKEHLNVYSKICS
ncbi:hypothetical protein LC593_07660 [Nostoc sp. CHAB 5844]|nr:hypothetical protein [Nostoc sp. CHAB 5844]